MAGLAGLAFAPFIKAPAFTLPAQEEPDWGSVNFGSGFAKARGGPAPSGSGEIGVCEL